MIVIINKHGQLANRIWAYISSMAKVIETDDKLFIFCFDEYYNLFENLNSVQNVRFIAPFKNTCKKRIIKQIYYLYSIFLAGVFRYFHLYGSYFNGKLRLIHGWETRNDKINVLYKNVLKQIFILNQSHVKETLDRIQVEKQMFKNLVTVHIRRGDYKTYKNGKYYFEDDTFNFYMQQVANCLGKKQTLFTICSNEKIDLSHFPNLNVKQFKENDAIQDLQVMLSSDYIMGVPSTFSRWASYINNIPCYLFQSKNASVSLNDFKIINRLDYFEDGSSVYID